MLSEYQRRKVLHLFNFYDINKDGQVGRIDFELAAAALCRTFGFEPNSVEAAALERSYGDYWAYLQRYMDLNMDKTISEQEFMARYEFLSRQPESVESLIFSTTEYVVQLTDRDDDGVIARKEYVAYLAAHHVDEAAADAAFNLLDHNLSNTLTRDEILNSVRIFLTSSDPEMPGNQLFGPVT